MTEPTTAPPPPPSYPPPPPQLAHPAPAPRAPFRPGPPFWWAGAAAAVVVLVASAGFLVGRASVDEQPGAPVHVERELPGGGPQWQQQP